MERRYFFKAALSTPFIQASNLSDDRAKKAVYVPSGKNRFDKILGGGEPNLLKLSGKDTNGDMCIFEGTALGKGGPRLHIHHQQDEWFHILEGEFLVQIGEEKFRLKAGDCILGPRGVPHTLAKVSDGVGRLLNIYQPAGQMEAYFIASGKRQTRATLEEAKKMFLDHGMEIVGPSLSIE